MKQAQSQATLPIVQEVWGPRQLRRRGPATWRRMFFASVGGSQVGQVKLVKVSG